MCSFIFRVSNPNFCAARTFFSLVRLRITTEKECVQSRRVLMRRTMSATFCSSLACSGSNSCSAFFSSGGRAAAALRRRRRSERGAMLFPIASKSSSTGGECSTFLNFGRRRFRGREERGRFGGGLRKENTTTTHLQKRGFVLASTNGINNNNNNNERLKLFSVSSSLL